MQVSEENYYVMSLDKVKEQYVIQKNTLQHIIIIDNFELGNNLKYVTNEYPIMLSRYMNLIDAKYINLITSYPIYKSVVLNNSNIYDEFIKICPLRNYMIQEEDHYLKLFQECKNILNSENIKTEIIMFTSQKKAMSNDTITLLDDIMNNNVSMSIVSLKNKEYDKLNDKIIRHYINPDETEITNIIFNGILLTEDLNKDISIKIKALNLRRSMLGCNTNTQADKGSIMDIHNYCWFVNNKLIHSLSGGPFEVTINDEKIEVIATEIKDTPPANLLNAIDTTINIINNEMDETKSIIDNYFEIYKFIKYQLIKIINENKQYASHAVLVYKELRQMLINNKDYLLKHNNNNNNKLMKYVEKTKVVMKNDKQTRAISEKMLFGFMNDSSDNNTEKCDIIYVKNDSFHNSCEFFTSIITLTNWYDEIQTNSALGLVIKIATHPLAKLGIDDNINIQNITTTFFPISDYIDIIIKYLEDNVINEKGNINDLNIFKGNAIGDGNSVIPLFITKQHWFFARKYLDSMLGITLCHNPYINPKNNINFMFRILSDFTIRSIMDPSERLLSTYVTLMRTCAEIAFENKYNRGIRKLIDIYITDPTRHINDKKQEYNVMLSQCLATGYYVEDEKLITLVELLIDELIRKALYHSYKKEYVLMLQTNDIQQNEDCKRSLIEYLDNKLKYDVKCIVCYYCMNSIFKKIISSYSKFIQTLDTNFGLVPDNIIMAIFNEIKNINAILITDFTIKNLCKFMNMPIYKTDTEIFACAIQNINLRKLKDKLYNLSSQTYIKVKDATSSKEIFEKYKIENIII